jgi:hypothetical protein
VAVRERAGIFIRDFFLVGFGAFISIVGAVVMMAGAAGAAGARWSLSARSPCRKGKLYWDTHSVVQEGSNRLGLEDELVSMLASSVRQITKRKRTPGR